MKKALVFGLAIAGASLPVHAADNADMDAMQEQLQMLQQQVEQLQRRLELQGQGQTDTTASNQSDSGDSSEDGDSPGTSVSVSSGAGQPRGSDMSKTEVEDLAKSTYEEMESNQVQVGGALRYNYTVAEFSEPQKDRNGDINFDTFRINVDADIDDLLFSAEYRFYDYMRTIHHGWVGYRFADDSQVEVGVTQVPFGILPYASNNFYFSSNFYTGYEDDYDAGVKYLGDRGAFNYQFAFFKNDEKGGDGGADRYSIDPTGIIDGLDADGGLNVTDTIQETNTFNARFAYTFGQDTDYTSELGVSGQYGQVYNRTQSKNYGDNTAYGIHLHGNYAQFELMLQAMTYEYDLDGGEDVIGAAAYAFNYPFASEADSYLANVSYTVPLNFGPFDSIEFYNDYTYVGGKSGDAASTWQNVTGAAVAAGNLYTYFDIINGKNEPFVNGFMAGPNNFDNAPTETLFNINMGYYF